MIFNGLQHVVKQTDTTGTDAGPTHYRNWQQDEFDDRNKHQARGCDLCDSLGDGLSS